MKVFDLNKLTSHPYEERDKNVFYQAKEFKTRIIELPPGGQMPVCEMESHVIFVVLDGEVIVTVNSETVTLKEKMCLVTEPATLSIKTVGSVRILGVQIATALTIKPLAG